MRISRARWSQAAGLGGRLFIRTEPREQVGPYLEGLLGPAEVCAERDPVDRHETADRGRHGRQEHRRVEVFAVDGRLDPDWRPWIACAARVTRLTWRKDTRTGLWARGEEVALYACQARLDAATFGRAVRAHLGDREPVASRT